jgi:thioesterase domain-containing protein
VQLVAKVERTFGRMVPLAAFFRTPTIAGVASQLAGEPGTEPSVIALQTGGNLPPLFLLSGTGGHVIGLRRLAQLADADRPIYGIQPRGLDGRSAPDRTVEKIAAFAVEQMRTVQPRGPYHLVGFSSGGTIAFEMAQQLEAQGDAVAVVVLIDTEAPGYPVIASLPVRVWLHLREFIRRSPREKIAYASDRMRGLGRRLRGKPSRRYAAELPQAGDSLSRLIVEHEQAVLDALKRYAPRPYRGKVVLLRADEKPQWIGMSFDDPYMGWAGFVPGGILLRRLPVTHLGIVKEPHVSTLAEALRTSIEEARSR